MIANYIKRSLIGSGYCNTVLATLVLGRVWLKEFISMLIIYTLIDSGLINHFSVF
jgi:hypothetical protein